MPKTRDKSLTGDKNIAESVKRDRERLAGRRRAFNKIKKAKLSKAKNLAKLGGDVAEGAKKAAEASEQGREAALSSLIPIPGVGALKKVKGLKNVLKSKSAATAVVKKVAKKGKQFSKKTRIANRIQKQDLKRIVKKREKSDDLNRFREEAIIRADRKEKTLKLLNQRAIKKNRKK